MICRLPLMAIIFYFVLGLWALGTDASAHGIGRDVRDHHKWLNMAVNCETKANWALGITHENRWRYNGHHDGGLQFSEATWTDGVRNRPKWKRTYKYAYQAPAHIQMRVANIIKRRYGLRNQWSCWRYFK